MTIDMKFFDVYYFCHLANESMGKFDYLSTNAEFTERQFDIEPEDFPKTSVLREYCLWLVDRVLYEQANSIANFGEVIDFNPISWIEQAVMKYRGVDISLKDGFEIDYDDYLETYNNYIEYLDKYEDGLFYNIISDIATEIEYILFQNRDFLLRFNEQQAVAFENNH